MAKAPAYQWYPGDFRRDTAVQACSFEARSLWREMMDLMHDGEPYGHLTAGGVPIEAAELARIVGIQPARCRRLLQELDDRKVFSRTDVGIIYSRRMVRDEEVRRKRAEGGRKGGNPALMKDKPKVEDKVNLPPNLLPTPAVCSLQSATALNGEQNAVAKATDGAAVDDPVAPKPEGAFDDPPSGKPETLHGYFMPLLRELGYAADDRDGSVLKRLDKLPWDDIEAAVRGLAVMRDAGELVRPLHIPKDGTLSLRILYAKKPTGEYEAQPWWPKAQQAYWDKLRREASGLKRVAI